MQESDRNRQSFIDLGFNLHYKFSKSSLIREIMKMFVILVSPTKKKEEERKQKKREKIMKETSDEKSLSCTT